MNTHDHQHDDALPGEEELQALYRSLPHKEPTAALDQAVRTAAAAAVRPQTRRRMARWPVAAASAAIVVLAVGLGVRMREQPANVQASAPATISNAPVYKPQISAPTSGAAIERVKLPDAPLAAMTAPPPRIASATRRTHPLAKAVTTSPAADALGEQAYAAAPAAAPAVVMAPVPASAPAMAAAPAPTPPSASADIRAAPEARSMAMKTMAMPASPAPMAARVMAPAPAADATAANPNDTPAQELDKIRALFAEHRRDEALQRVSRFRQAHPEISLPDDLRAQLPDHE